MKSNMICIETSAEARLQTITFSDPAHFNGMHFGNIDAMPQAIVECSASEATYLVVQTSGDVFCSGGSPDFLLELSKLPRAEQSNVFKRGQRWVNELLESPCFTVAAVNGLVSGAGIDFLLAFDLVLFGPKARCNLWYSKVGAIPDLGGLHLLAERFGASTALDMYSRSETWDQARATSLGLGEACEQLPVTPTDWLARLQRRHPIERGAWARAKAILHGVGRPALLSNQNAVTDAQIDLIAGADFQARMSRVAALQRVRN